MRVTHLTNTNGKGGAAIAVRRLHYALLKAGVDSQIYALTSVGEDSRVTAFDYRLSLVSRLVRSVRARLYKLDYKDYDRRQLGERDEYFSSDRCHLGSASINQIPPCDCVHLHWISGFIDIRTLCRQLLTKQPAVWTLHDMNPFTGGCHSTQDCRRYLIGCGRCPLLGGRRERDSSWQIFRRKRLALASIKDYQMTIVAPSRWIADQARVSPILAGKRVEVIPHPVDTTTFFPSADIDVPELIQLRARGKVIILFIAQWTMLPRKGYRLLKAALERVSPLDGALLLTVGGSQPPSPQGIAHFHLTTIEDPVQLNQVYNLADLCVVPSQYEAFGMTTQEALTAGTPVIGFDTVGCADMVRSGWNGILVETGDIAGLANALSTLVADKATRRRMSVNARSSMMEQCAEQVVAESYSQVYERLLSGGSR